MAFSSRAVRQGRLALLVLAWLAPVAANAEDPPPAPVVAPAPQNTGAGEEIVVYGQAEIRRRRQELDQRLRTMGYRAVKQKDGKTVYRPETVWYPSVIIDEEGFAVLKRSPIRFSPPGKGDSKLRYLWCIPPLTVMCVHANGLLISNRKLTPLKGKVAEAIDPSLDAWTEALAKSATWERLSREIPALLEATWTTGAPLEPSGPRYATPEERRDAIVEFWTSRAQTPEGGAARDVIGLYIVYEIQGSPWPVTPEQVAGAERRCGCDQRLLEPAYPELYAP